GEKSHEGVALVNEAGDKTDALPRTRVGPALGTPVFMSPEQAKGKNNELDGRSDLYTLGLILQQIVTLKRAVGGTTMLEVLTNALEGKREDLVPHAAAGTIPREISA